MKGGADFSLRRQAFRGTLGRRGWRGCGSKREQTPIRPRERGREGSGLGRGGGREEGREGE